MYTCASRNLVRQVQDPPTSQAPAVGTVVGQAPRLGMGRNGGPDNDHAAQDAATKVAQPMNITLPKAISTIARTHPDLAAPVVYELRRARRDAARYRSKLRAAEAEIDRLNDEFSGDAA